MKRPVHKMLQYRGTTGVTSGGARAKWAHSMLNFFLTSVFRRLKIPLPMVGTPPAPANAPAADPPTPNAKHY